jgi:hypothetical protein
MEIGRVVRELSGTVVGWRVWTVRETSDGLRLGSVLHDLVWPADGAALAGCAVDPAPHAVPGRACNCGFHAARDPVEALSYLVGRDLTATVCRILGEVALWGHVLETDSGWRSSHAFPLRLYVPDDELVSALSVYDVSISSVHARRPRVGHARERGRVARGPRRHRAP